jgi:hypothetical protein
MTSPYLTRERRSEQTARSDIAISRASNVVRFPSAADEAADRIAEEATRAFWECVRLGQPLPKAPLVPTTADLLQHAKNHAHRLWAEENLTEKEFNAAMVEFCWCLADGDELKAKFLASAVVS